MLLFRQDFNQELRFSLNESKVTKMAGPIDGKGDVFVRRIGEVLKKFEEAKCNHRTTVNASRDDF